MISLYGALTRTDDDYAVSFERDYPTTTDDLWECVTDPERLARWFAPIEGDLRPGGSVVAHFDDGEARFMIETCAAPEALVVRWQHEDHDTVVRVAVLPLGDERSRLTLVHERLTRDQAPRYAGGWHWHLDALSGACGAAPGTTATWDDLFADYESQLGDATTARA